MTNGIDKETGMIDIFELLPDEGDSLLVVNCGDHYEMKQQSIRPPFLTDEDLEFLRAGSVIWH